MDSPDTVTSLSHLSSDIRDELLDWVVDFDLHWRKGLLESHLSSLPTHLEPWRTVAVAELVKIDMIQMWKRKSEVPLESYLETYPELGTSETVSAELILAELEARKLAGQRMSGRELKDRFPLQSAAVRQAISSGSMIGKSVIGQSRISGSRIARTIGLPSAKDTASLAPGETFSSQPKPAPVPVSSRNLLVTGSAFGPNGRYRIVKELGGGGMGSVYLAKDTALGNRKVAIKVPHFSPTDGPEMLERFQREAELLATISHPNLGIVYDVNECDGVNFLVMEYISGTSLADYIEKKPLPLDKSVWLIRRIAQALQPAHAKGIVHRDLKPENIMLTRDGQPKVIDFGLAVNVESGGTRATQQGMTMGTPEYMPLEQVTGDLTKIGPRSDVYSLGIMLYKLLAGTVPFTGDTPLAVGVKIFNETAVSPQVHNTDIDSRLADIVLKAIAKEPENRYGSMEEFAQTLINYAKTAGDPDAASAITFLPAEQFPCFPEVHTPTVISDSTTVECGLPSFDVVHPVKHSELAVQDFPQTSIAAAQRKRKGSHLGYYIGFSCLAAFLGVVLYFRTDDTLIRVDVKSPNVTVTFHDNRITLTDGTQQFRVEPGRHRLHVKSGNAEFDTDIFTVKEGDTAAVIVEVVDATIVAKAGSTPIGTHVLATKATQPEIGEELLINGSCDAPLSGGIIPGWTVVSGLWGAESKPSFAFDGPACFRPGPALNSEIIQDVSLEQFAESIQKGELEMTFREHVLSLASGEKARAIIEFRHSSIHAPFAIYDTGYMSLNRNWQELSHIRSVPPGTAFIRIRLLASLTGTEKRDVYFDGVSLVVNRVSKAGASQIPTDATAFNNHFYKFYAEQLTWKEAQARCEELGGHLVIIDSKEEQRIVSHLISSSAWQDCWLGITDENQEGEWVTVAGGPLSYSNWYTAQPNNKQWQEHFGLLSNREIGGKRIAWMWCDQPNQALAPHQPGFVCEWETVTKFEQELIKKFSLNTASHAPPLKSIRVEKVRQLTGHAANIRSLAFTPDGKRLASGSYGVTIQRSKFVCGPDNTVRIWNVETGAEIRKFGLSGGQTSRGVQGLAISPDGRYVAAACSFDYVHTYAFPRLYIWDIATGSRRTFFGEKATCKFRHVTFSPDSSILTVLGETIANHSYNVTDGSERPIPDMPSKLLLVGVSDNSASFVRADPAGPLLLWDFEKGQEVARFDGFTQSAIVAVPSLDNAYLLASSNDYSIRCWERSTGKTVFERVGLDARARSLSFSRDGRYFAASCDDGYVSIHNALTGERFARVKAHEGRVNAVCFSPVDDVLATGGNDDLIQLWRVGEQVHLTTTDSVTDSVIEKQLVLKAAM